MHMWASDTVGGVPLHVYAYGQQPTMVHCRRKLVRHTDRGRGQRPTRARDISAAQASRQHGTCCGKASFAQHSKQNQSTHTIIKPKRNLPGSLHCVCVTNWQPFMIAPELVVQKSTWLAVV